MKRGEVWWVSFAPSVGGEIQKTRPAIVISNNAANAALNRVQVIPVTSNTQKMYPGEAIFILQGIPHKAMSDQITTVSKTRFFSRIDSISESDLRSIELAIKIQLALP